MENKGIFMKQVVIVGSRNEVPLGNLKACLEHACRVASAEGEGPGYFYTICSSTLGMRAAVIGERG